MMESCKHGDEPICAEIESVSWIDERRSTVFRGINSSSVQLYGHYQMRT
jgi:hypothetical protein